MYLFTLLTLVLPAFALPQGIGAQGPTCEARAPTYKTYTHNIVDGPSTLAAVACRPGAGGCSVSLAEAYSIGVDVTVGFDLGINNKQASAGISASVSYSTSRITTDTGTVNCPAGSYTCGLAITPSVLKVTGHVTWSTPLMACWTNQNEKDGDYTIEYPIKDSQGKPRVDVWACACPDKKGWADKGAPPKCPGTCDGATMEN